MKKSILTPILAVLDILLLALIIVSARKVGNVQPEETKPAQSVAVTGETESGLTTEVPADVDTTTVLVTTDPETTQEQITSNEESTDLSETVLVPVVPADTEVPGEEGKEEMRDASAYDTHDLPTIKDFKWVTPEILNGVCPDDAEAVYFEESLGGWKCYIVDEETGVERLANMELSGKEDDLELCIDWYYARIGGKDGEAYEDNAPDSVFEGSANDSGEIEAGGPGKILLTDLYAIGDHMYAFGTIYWPDGMKGNLMLVRP